MKKLMILLAAVFALTVNSFSQEEQCDSIKLENLTITLRQLNEQYYQLHEEQIKMNEKIALAGYYQEQAGKCYNQSLVYFAIGSGVAILTSALYAYCSTKEYYPGYTYADRNKAGVNTLLAVGGISAFSLDIVGLVKLIQGNSYLKKSGTVQSKRKINITDFD